MKITTELPVTSGLIGAVDKDASDVFVLVIKATFDILLDGGEPKLAAQQEPLVVADTYFGEPGLSSIQYAYDFAIRKPAVDVVVIGTAHAPRQEPVPAVRVRLAIEGRLDKTIQVVGDRHWDVGMVRGIHSTPPQPFTTMPLIYERAFGGADTSDANPKRHVFHLENLVGAGMEQDRSVAAGKRLPNLEHPSRPIANWGDGTPTIGFGFVSPNWKPRTDYCGTYDDAWLADRFPFLPDDFNDLFFQAAPADQVMPELQGGEVFTLVNLSPQGTLRFALPRMRLPVVFLYADKAEEIYEPRLDTVVIEPDRSRLVMAWRLTTPRRGKLDSLREVVIGTMSDKWWRRRRSWKPHYSSLDKYVRSRQ